MKTQLSMALILLASMPLFAATIRIENRTTHPVTTTVITPKKEHTQSIHPGKSQFYNTWTDAVTAIMWKSHDGSVWRAPISMKALQVEARLNIMPEGHYTYRGCILPAPVCNPREDVAEKIAPKPLIPPAPAMPETPAPSAPPMPPAQPEKPAISKGLAEELSNVQLKKATQPQKPAKPITPQDAVKKEIKEGAKTLKPAASRPLPPRPDTSTPRDKLLEDIKKGKTLRPTTTIKHEVKPQHELQKPIESEFEKRRSQIESLREEETPSPTDESEWD